MLAGWSFMLWNTSDGHTIGGLRLHEIGWFLLLTMALVLPICEVLFSRQLSLKNIGYSFFGLLYISLSWGCMMDLRSEGMMFEGTNLYIDLGWIVPIVLISAIWINDTMAYIVGSFIGKTPLSKISPKKTWEGTIGGAILAILVVTLGGHYLFNIPDITSLFSISLIATVMGTVGDLVESKLKRLAVVKDSGQIMPGHGGFLDRFDSLILATPFVWLYLKTFM
jgi:phosphatidate cytidylyltransferase